MTDRPRSVKLDLELVLLTVGTRARLQAQTELEQAAPRRQAQTELEQAARDSRLTR